MSRSLSVFLLFLVSFMQLEAKSIYPFAKKSESLKPFNASILLKEASEDYLLESNLSTKSPVKSFKDLPEALKFDVSHDTENSIPDFFRTLDVEIHLDSINWTEFASKNNQAKALWRDLISCSNSDNPIDFYFKYEFEQCPELKNRIDEFRRSLVDFLTNTSFRSVDKFNIESIFYSVKSKNALGDVSRPVLDGVIREYTNIYYPSKSNLIFNEKSKYQGDYIGHVSSFSELFRNHYPRIENLIEPFFVQILIEMNGFLNYPNYAVYLDKEGKPKPSLFMGMSALKKVKSLNVPVEVPSVYDFDSNNFYRSLMSNKEDNYIRTEFTDLYQESNENEKLYLFYNSRPMFSVFIDEGTSLAIGNHFPDNYILYSKIGLSSLRLLTNLSFLIEPDRFGLTPNQNLLFFIASSREFIFRDSPIQYLSKWIAGNLTDFYYPKDCNCRNQGQVLENNEFEALSMLNPFRFYLSQSFPAMIGLELKE
ncbi:MAG: hypothetical protein VX642_01365 [Bdellovibrionota bacterium]|nr:hypothetical protein [Bdellovibrionota bacterium]